MQSYQQFPHDTIRVHTLDAVSIELIVQQSSGSVYLQEHNVVQDIADEFGGAGVVSARISNRGTICVAFATAEHRSKNWRGVKSFTATALGTKDAEKVERAEGEKAS